MSADRDFGRAIVELALATAESERAGAALSESFRMQKAADDAFAEAHRALRAAREKLDAIIDEMVAAVMKERASLVEDERRILFGDKTKAMQLGVLRA